MPSIGTYVSDEVADAITAAAALRNGGKVAPWIAEACRQRLEREGMLPGDPKAEITAAALSAADEVGHDKVLGALRRLGMKRLAEAKGAA